MKPGIDRAVAATWVVVLLMTVALLANVTYVQGFQAKDLRESSLNARRLLDRNTVERGPIVADGQRLAWSTLTSDGKTYQRHYADSKIFSPITGYFSPFSQTGVEGAENHFLDGSDSRLATTNLVDKLIGKQVPGGTVETTINVKAQRAAYSALQSLGGRRGAAVAIDAETGAILVMASTPSYDANAVSVLDGDKAQAAFKKLNAEQFKPLLNKATGEVYPPGSTFKTIVASAALNSGKSESSQVRAGRTYQPPGGGNPINNDAGDIGGECDQSPIPLIDAYAQSCNTTFAFMGAEDPGNAAVYQQAGKYGFGDRIEIADGMSSAASSFPKTDQPVLSALGSFGQGDTVATPLQMAMVTAGVLNDGKVMKPYLVDKLRSSSGSVVDQAHPSVLSRALSSDQAGEMQDLMKAVVSRGTGKTLQGTPVLGGKTGTADVANKSYNDRWFIGFGPRNDPKYAIAVMSEKAGYGIDSGPVAAKILEALGG